LGGPIDQAWEKWDAWRPAEAARVLAEVRAPWCVAAGWAIDLFLGGQRREHEDLEIAVPGARFGEVAAALGDYELYVPGRIGERYVAWPLAEEPERLETHNQTLVREPATAGASTSSASRPTATRGSANATRRSGCPTPT